MKSLILFPTLIAAIQFLSAQTNNTNPSIYDALVSANREWLSQQPDEVLLQKNTVFTCDDALIQFHLNRVEARLRAAGTIHLSETQKLNRQMCLNHLHEYWLTGRFPKNTHHNIAHPISLMIKALFAQLVTYLLKQPTRILRKR